MTEIHPNRREAMRLGLAAAVVLAVPNQARAELRETPLLENDVGIGNLPKVEQRVPEDPAVAELEAIGTPGGELRMLMGGPKDTRMMVVYGYARLVGYTPLLKFAPDILKSIDIEDNSIFTLHLRKGHKWSDGQPFTTEDFRYWFEDVAQNKHLSPSGLPISKVPALVKAWV